MNRWAVASVLVFGCQRPVGPTVQSAAVSHNLAAPGEHHLANITQLTFGGENAEAYWSNDGTELIFQSTRPGVACDQIFRMSVADPVAQTMVSDGRGRTTCAYFLPGDKDVLYASTAAHGPACPPPPDQSMGYVWALYDYDIYRAKADGSNPVRLTQTPAYDAEATVCPKDGRILFTSDRDGDLELYVMAADGSDVKRLTQTPGYDGGAFFSPDCQEIVWRASRPSGESLVDYQRLLAQRLVRPTKLEIYVANADGTNARQVTYLGAASFAPYFHPAGDRILFSTNYPNPRGREFDIWSIGKNGAGLERITFAEGFDGFPMFSPDGKRLAFASNRRDLAADGTYRVTGGPVGARDTNVFVADWVEGARGATDPATAAADRIAVDVAYLADDARQGRGLGTAGLETALTWTEQQFQAVGLTPLDKTYRHPFTVTAATKRTDKTSLQVDGRAVPDAAFAPYHLSSVKQASGVIVDVGWGLDAAAYAGTKGKLALAHRFEPEKSHVRGDTSLKASLARAAGAVGLVLIDDGVPKNPESPLPELAAARSADAGIPVVFVTREWKQRLVAARAVAFTAGLQNESVATANIVGVLRGSDPTRPAIVVGAHIDHLGHGGHASLDGTGIHNGADDNASGVAALLEAARLLVAKKSELVADVMFAAFSAEEIGTVGSTKLANELTQPLAAMLNMDMVGRMRDNYVFASGGDSALEWRSLLLPLCEAARVRCDSGGSGYGPSDHMAFYQRGVPVLHFFTGAHMDYHRQSDDAPLVNAAGAARVAELVAGLAGKLAAAAPVALTYQKSVAPAPMGERRRGASLGTVPSYNDDAGAPAGVLLSDVVPGGAAAKAGLAGGDRIIAIGPREVRNVQEFMDVLVAARPGDPARITFVRAGQTRVIETTFGAPRSR